MRAQFWIDGAPVALQSTMWVSCEEADQALDDLGEGDLVVWVRRDPLDDDATIERPEQVPAAVGEVMARIGITAEQMRAHLSVEAFIAELASDPETSESAPMTVPVVLAVNGREREAREQARRVPGDFADRLDRWLAGERPPPPEPDHPFPWAEMVGAAIRKARAVTPEERAQRPQMSWDDLWRTGGSLVRALHGELPRLPDRKRAWHDVELDAGAPPVLEAARADSKTVIFVDAYIEARVERDQAGRVRVLIDGVDVGSLSAPDHAASAGVRAGCVPGAPASRSRSRSSSLTRPAGSFRPTGCPRANTRKPGGTRGRAGGTALVHCTAVRGLATPDTCPAVELVEVMPCATT